MLHFFINKMEKIPNILHLQEKNENFIIQTDGKSQLTGEWELGEESEGGWRSIRDVETGNYLTATSSNTLTLKGKHHEMYNLQF